MAGIVQCEALDRARDCRRAREDPDVGLVHYVAFLYGRQLNEQPFLACCNPVRSVRFFSVVATVWMLPFCSVVVHERFFLCVRPSTRPLLMYKNNQHLNTFPVCALPHL